jgi:hypothetical protein
MFAKTLPLLVVPAAAIALAGCGSSASNPQTTANAAAAGGAPVSVDARSAAGAYTSAQLREALLSRVNGELPATQAEAGAYGSLPEVKATKYSMHGVSVTPAACAQATLTGFNSATFANVPAAVSTFRVGRNGVSEVLMAPSSGAAAAALGKSVPSECSHYRATVGGKTYSYQIHEAWTSGIGSQARVLNVRAVGYPQVTVWSVVFRGTGGLVGALTIVGPNSSQTAARQLAQQAYTYATSRLG